MEPRNQLIALAIKFRGDWRKIYECVDRKIFLEDEEVDAFLGSMRCQALTIIDKGYPEYLKNIRMPPFVLFYYGDISLIKDQEKHLTVVGTREPSELGTRITKEIIKGLSKDIIVVSGLAKGIDAIAHQAAIDSGHKTIAVLGSGINICYPTENSELYEEIMTNHLVLSEYPTGEQPCQYYFPMRNRIVAGLGMRTLVTEARRRSGTYITVMETLELGNDVLCVPSVNFGDSGCNLCIKEGAYLVENSDDVNYFFRFSL